MKFDDDKNGNPNESAKERFAQFAANHDHGRNDDNVNSEVVSTFRSLDLPPKEYEQQLQ